MKRPKMVLRRSNKGRNGTITGWKGRIWGCFCLSSFTFSWVVHPSGTWGNISRILPESFEKRHDKMDKFKQKSDWPFFKLSLKQKLVEGLLQILVRVKEWLIKLTKNIPLKKENVSNESTKTVQYFHTLLKWLDWGTCESLGSVKIEEMNPADTKKMWFNT